MITKEAAQAILLKHSRTFTREDILRFADVSGDRGTHHVDAPVLMAHGLLIASLPTKIGGDMNFLARNMFFDFRKPVFEGDTITTAGVIEDWLVQKKRIKCSFRFDLTNQRGEVVMRGTSAGMIWKNPEAGAPE